GRVGAGAAADRVRHGRAVEPPGVPQLLYRRAARRRIAVLGAIARREDARHVRLEPLVHEHAAPDLDARPGEKPDVRLDADGDADEARRDLLAVRRHHGAHAALARDLPDLRAETQVHAVAADLARDH